MSLRASSLVILRRLLDAGWLAQSEFDEAWRAELARLASIQSRSSGGGDFFKTTSARVGRRLAEAIVISTLEGQTLYRDAFRRLGISKTKTFNKLDGKSGMG